MVIIYLYFFVLSLLCCTFAKYNMKTKTTNYRWVICGMLFFATTINYMDRQVLSLTYPGMIENEFHWDEAMYGTITGVFSIVYAAAMLFAGKFIDMVGSKKGYLWAIGIWSTGACLHAVCGIGTELLTGCGDLKSPEMLQLAAGSKMALAIGTVSVWMFVGARCILAIGEAGNFPAAIKVTAEYFEPKDRAFATAVFNSGCSIGALIAPFAIPLLAKFYGWEMAFIIIGGLGYIWMGAWVFIYSPNPHINDNHKDVSVSYGKVFRMREAWALFLCRLVSDGGWWFFLFWTPMYLSTEFGIKPTDTEGMVLIFVLYLITMLSIFGGRVPNIFIRKGRSPFQSHIMSMFIFACIPLLGLLAQPAGQFFHSPWAPIVLIGVLGASHQSWSANMFSVVSDKFSSASTATVTSLSGAFGGVSNFLLNIIAGYLFTYAGKTDMVFMGFTGKSAGYMIMFCWCALAYLIGWTLLKLLMKKEEK